MEYRASEEEFYSDESEFNEGSANVTGKKVDDAEGEWSEEIRLTCMHNRRGGQQTILHGIQSQ